MHTSTKLKKGQILKTFNLMGDIKKYLSGDALEVRCKNIFSFLSLWKFRIWLLNYCRHAINSKSPIINIVCIFLNM